MSRGLGHVLRAAWPILLVLGIAWVSRYLYLADFGLYEDDWTIVPRAAAMSGSEVVRYVADYVVHLYGHGRPLSDSLIYLFSWLGWRLGGLAWMYVFGFLFFGLNCVLVYALARRVAGEQVAVLAGLAFAVYPADTTQAYLTHSLGLQPSLSFALLAIHAYLSRKAWLTYPLAALVLFTYETPFGLIAAAPLLAPGAWDRPRLRRLLLHGLALGLILGAALGLRIAISDDRVTGLPLSSALLTSLLHMVQGPLASLGMLVFRPITAFQRNDLLGWFVAGLAFVVLAVGLAALTRVPVVPTPDVGRPVAQAAQPRRRRWPGWRARWELVPQEAQNHLRFLVAGLVMLVLAYPLTYTVRAYAITGRETRVHFAAAAGTALVVGALAAMIWDALRARGLGRLGALLIALEIGLLVGFGQVIQADYRTGWVSQQRFWSFLVEQIPDAREGIVILVEPAPLGDVDQIGANTWNLPSVLEQLYVFPPEWDPPPRVIRLEPNWREHILSGEGPLQLEWRSVLAPSYVWGEIEGWNVTLLLDEGGELVRQSGPMDIAGQMTSLMTTDERGEPPYPHRLLYDLVVPDSGSD